MLAPTMKSIILSFTLCLSVLLYTTGFAKYTISPYTATYNMMLFGMPASATTTLTRDKDRFCLIGTARSFRLKLVLIEKSCGTVNAMGHYITREFSTSNHGKPMITADIDQDKHTISVTQAKDGTNPAFKGVVFFDGLLYDNQSFALQLGDDLVNQVPQNKWYYQVLTDHHIYTYQPQIIEKNVAITIKDTQYMTHLIKTHAQPGVTLSLWLDQKTGITVKFVVNLGKKVIMSGSLSEPIKMN